MIIIFGALSLPLLMLKNKFSLDYCDLLSDESFHKYTCNIGINNSYLCTEDDVLRSMREEGHVCI